METGIARHYAEAEVSGLLDALEEKSTEISHLMVAARRDISNDSLDGYFRFRELSTEFEAFCIIIEIRLDNLTPEAPVEALKVRYEDCVFGVLRALVDAALDILFSLSSRKVLPLGSKDVFLNELKSLYYTREKMNEARFQSRLDDEARTQLDKAEQILMQIIDRAPAMLDLGPTHRPAA